MRRFFPVITALLTMLSAPTVACDTVSELQGDRAWTIRVAEDSWSLPFSCTAVLDAVAELVVRQRGRYVSVESVLGAGAPSSLAIARLAALAGRIETGLLERGLGRHRVKIREFRLRAQPPGEAVVEHLLIFRVVDP